MSQKKSQDQSRKGYVLVINCGSSSLKYEVIQFPEQQSVGKGIIERIGDQESIFTHKATLQHKVHEDHLPIADHTEAFHLVEKMLTNEKFKVIESNQDIIAVGHRVVHGGETYSASIVIDDEVKRTIKDLSRLAPLHNPANHAGIEAAQQVFKHCKHVAVFDTAFHQTMPARAYMYALPYVVYKEYGIRRYGMHGTSHQYVTNRAAEILKKKVENVNLITCHLGNGSSITAVRKGKSVDTSMGLTPLAGVMMGTRCGDIDPAIVTFLMEQNEEMTTKGVDNMLNKKSGLLGISGISNDMRDIEEAETYDNRAVLALEMYAHNIRKYIGAYVAELVHVDMIVFTAGIGEFGKKMRFRICKLLEGLGVFIDAEKNLDYKKYNNIISTDDSPVKIAVIPTNEELQIALDAYQLTD